jgi:hypothetical protein
MSRFASRLIRVALAAVVSLLVLAVSRWGPVHAEPPVDVRALPLGGLFVLLAVLTGFTGGARPALPLRRIAWSLVVATVLLGLVVTLRPPAGLLLRVDGPGTSFFTPDAPLEIFGRDFRDRVDPRRAFVRWQGTLNAPASGTYALEARGRGRLEVRIDGHAVLSASGESFHAEAPLPLTAGRHEIAAELGPHGPGLHLRLGWTRPDRFGSRHESVVPPRYLGSSPPGWWRVTDLLALAMALLAGALVYAAPWDRPRSLTPPVPVTPREIGVSTLGYAALVAAMSWPLVLDPVHRGVIDRPDGRLNAWILAWDVHALVHEPGRLFQAPIFHPLPDALAFSENLLVPAVLGAPALWLGGPVLAYNFVLLLSLVASGLGAQLLVRRVSGDRLAAFVGGAVFAAGAHRWVRLAHLHAEVTLFLPLALLALDRFWERRTLRRALLVGLLLALQGLSSVYLGAITATALLAAVLVSLLGGLRPADLGKLGLGVALASLLLAPVASPYFRMREFQGVEFTEETVAEYATTLESYAASGTRAYGGITLRHLDPARVQDTLFPGLVTLLVGLGGLAVAPRRYRAVIVAASALAVVLSLGPATSFYRFLHEHVVLFRSVRALSRFSLIPVLGLSVLVGLALSGRRIRVSGVALLAMMLESTNAPLGFGQYAGPPPAARWLAGREGAVAYLPLGERDTEVMLDGVAHFRPLVNGDSGFLPRPYDRAMELLEGPLHEDALRFLRAVGVRHVVTRRDLGLPSAAEIGGERILEVPPGKAAERVAEGRAAPTLFAGGGVVVDLGEAAPVGRVSFEVSDAPWIARPRVAASVDGLVWHEVEASASLADATLDLTRDPRRGRGEVRFAPRRARFLRIDPRLPARPGAFAISP